MEMKGTMLFGKTKTMVATVKKVALILKGPHFFIA